MPAVLVAIVRSSPDIVRSPAIVKFLIPVKSLSESTIIAFDAETVPGVIPSTKFNSAVVEVTPSNILSSAVVEVTPSSIFNSAPVEVIVVPPKVKEPDISTLPFMSTVVAAICISVSATKSNCPSAEELMYIAVSLNCIFSVVLINISSENWK